MRRIALVLVAGWLLGAPGVVGALSVVPKEFVDLVQEAEAVFVGEIVERQSYRGASGGIFTGVTFAVDTVLKGAVPPRITLEFLGGAVDGQELRIPGWPWLEVGQRYAVFARGNGRDILPVVGGPQGLFRVAPDPATGQARVFNAFGYPIASPTVRAALGAASAAASPVPGLAAEAVVAGQPTLDQLLEAVRKRLGARP